MRSADAGRGAQPRVAPRALTVGLAVAAIVLVAAEVALGGNASFDLTFGELLQGLGALWGLAEPLSDSSGSTRQIALEMRLWRALTGLGVGSCLAVSGALLQGLFRNGLASPSLLGVTSGASLGASVAILITAGVSSGLVWAGTTAPWWTTAAACLGALLTTAFVVTIAGRSRTDMATVLLVGVAVNTCVAGLMMAIQNLLSESQHFHLLKPMLEWSFGTLESRRPYHVTLVVVGVALVLQVIPFVSRELDLLASGDADAESLGVDTARLRLIVIVTAAVATAVSVAAAGQVGFVGLIVPHGVRVLVGSSHRHVLPLSLLGGGVFLLGTDLLQVVALGYRPLNPGVLMSLIGGPLFLTMLIRWRRRTVG